jgi:Protein of unknown function (DUF3168)
MSSAIPIVQEAVVAALRGSIPVMATVSGVYDGPPARAAFPYVSVGDSLTSDWSSKTWPGREIRVALTVWDDGEMPSRIHSLMSDVENAVTSVARDLDGWRVVSVVYLRSIVARTPTGAWAGLVEHRVRVMAV